MATDDDTVLIAMGVAHALDEPAVQSEAPSVSNGRARAVDREAAAGRELAKQLKRAWLSWEGEQAGNFAAAAVTLRVLLEAHEAALDEPAGETTFDELIHSGGRCTCSGEGRCDWCKSVEPIEPGAFSIQVPTEPTGRPVGDDRHARHVRAERVLGLVETHIRNGRWRTAEIVIADALQAERDRVK